MLTAEELNAYYWPQLFLVSDENLSTEQFPDLLNLSRTSLDTSQIYVIFNTFNIYLWIGNQADPYYLN